MRLGILGGTFDPIHFGHLFIAEEARCSLDLDQVIFLPNGHPPHKAFSRLTTASHRLEMTRIAIASNPNFVCSTIEAERSAVSYTVDTLKELQGTHPEARLFYITGVDTIADLMTWRNPDEVVRLAVFVAVTRPGYDLSLLQDRLPPEIMKRIEILESDSPEISSSVVRERAMSSLPVRYLVPDEVLKYIEKHQLYR